MSRFDSDLSIRAVVSSLVRRGFLPSKATVDHQRAIVQVFAVLEELAEVAHCLEPESSGSISVTLGAIVGLGRMARRLRRSLQGLEPPPCFPAAVIAAMTEVERVSAPYGKASTPTGTLADEGLDTLIAATALASTLSGADLIPGTVAKLARDEQRGWLHSGKTRAEFEQQRMAL
jgi:hypothetical protein